MANIPVKRGVGGLAVLGFNSYYKATTKTVYWPSARQTANRIE
jgi:hypothetical protein